jgi:hypothetical protein
MEQRRSGCVGGEKRSNHCSCRRLNHGRPTHSLVAIRSKGFNRLWMFVNGLLMRIVGSKRVEITGEWRNFHNKELLNLYSLCIIKVMKLRRIRWAKYVETWMR